MKQPQEKSVSEQLKELQAKVEASRGVPTAEELLKRHSMTPLSGQAYERNLKCLNHHRDETTLNRK
jgi:hypothetical protein